VFFPVVAPGWDPKEIHWGQVVKVIWHKAASLLYTDDSIIFTRWRKYAPHLVHPNQHPTESLWVYWLPNMSGVSAPGTLCHQNCPFTWEGYLPHPVRGSLIPPKSASRTTSRSFLPLWHHSPERKMSASACARSMPGFYFDYYFLADIGNCLTYVICLCVSFACCY